MLRTACTEKSVSACTEKSGLEIQHISLKDRETTAIVGRWKQNIKMSYQQGKPTP